jgi:hypothetical protein
MLTLLRVRRVARLRRRPKLDGVEKGTSTNALPELCRLLPAMLHETNTAARWNPG